MMEVQPPHHIGPIDETTQARVDNGEVIVGSKPALMSLRKRLLAKARRKTQKQSRKANKRKR